MFIDLWQDKRIDIWNPRWTSANRKSTLGRVLKTKTWPGLLVTVLIWISKWKPKIELDNEDIRWNVYSGNNYDLVDQGYSCKDVVISWFELLIHFWVDTQRDLCQDHGDMRILTTERRTKTYSLKSIRLHCSECLQNHSGFDNEHVRKGNRIQGAFSRGLVGQLYTRERDRALRYVTIGICASHVRITFIKSSQASRLRSRSTKERPRAAAPQRLS